MQLSDALQDQLAAKLGQVTDEPEATDQSTLGRIAAIVEKVSGFEAQEVERDHSPEDLGLGSLERIEVAVRVEEAFGVRIDDRHVATLATVGEFADYVDELQA